MKKLLIALSAALAVAGGGVMAAPAKAAAKKPQVAKKKSAPKAKKAVSKKSRVPQVLKVNPLTGANAPAAPLPAAGMEFPAQALEVLTGFMQCELGANVTVTPAGGADQFSYQVKTNRGHSYDMRQVPTTTGAVRLEDKVAGATWIQLGNKSMLMDQKRGERIATECRNTQQQIREEELKKAPPPNLLD